LHANSVRFTVVDSRSVLRWSFRRGKPQIADWRCCVSDVAEVVEVASILDGVRVSNILSTLGGD
jgi:hypothetical protein